MICCQEEKKEKVSWEFCFASDFLIKYYCCHCHRWLICWVIVGYYFGPNLKKEVNLISAWDSDTSHGIVFWKNNTYQRTFFIVASSLLELLVLIAVVGTSGSLYLQSSAQEIAWGTVVLANYQVGFDNLGLNTFFCFCAVKVKK